MTRQKIILCIVAVSILVAFAATVWWLRPQVHVSVNRQLVGPRDKAMELLLQGAPLDEIQAGVRRSGKQVDQITHLGGTLLFYAAKQRREAVAQWFLTQGANPNGTYQGVGAVPLEVAVRNEDVAMIRLLVQAGADPDLELGDNMTPRKRAEEINQPAILAALESTRGAATTAQSRPASLSPTDGASSERSSSN